MADPARGPDARVHGVGAAARRIVAVAGITLREALRRRVVIAALLMAVGFMVLYGLAAHFASGSILGTGQTGLDALMRRAVAVQLLYLGLFPASFLVALTALFAGAGTISAEVDSGVIYGVLARPVRRAEVVVGKFLGLAAMLALYAGFFYGGVIGLARWQLGVPLTQWPLAMAVFVFEPMPLLALAVLGSTRLPTLANGVLGLAAWGLAFIGGLIEQIGGMLNNETMAQIGIVSSLLMPVDALHRLALSLLVPPGLLVFQGGGPPGMGAPTPSVWMLVYSVAYVVALVALAARVFGRRDL
jgi:Cu-processing system permease protein